MTKGTRMIIFQSDSGGEERGLVVHWMPGMREGAEIDLNASTQAADEVSCFFCRLSIVLSLSLSLSHLQMPPWWL